MIGIINYGMGNLKSVTNALSHINIDFFIVNSAKEFNKADKLILPGVGAFGKAMLNIKELGFDESIKESTLIQKKPLLGICLGMQLLLTKSSEFGDHVGLDLIDGEVIDFKDRIKNLPVPHVGWNNVKKVNSSLISDQYDNKDYYFVHTYHCNINNKESVSGITNYDFDFHSMLELENIFGCQFHPEKSQEAGLAIFKNFSNL